MTIFFWPFFVSQVRVDLSSIGQTSLSCRPIVCRPNGQNYRIKRILLEEIEKINKLRRPVEKNKLIKKSYRNCHIIIYINVENGNKIIYIKQMYIYKHIFQDKSCFF